MNRPEEDWSARRLHFVGIGGAGMSGLALIARELGAQRDRLRSGRRRATPSGCASTGSSRRSGTGPKTSRPAPRSCSRPPCRRTIPSAGPPRAASCTARSCWRRSRAAPLPGGHRHPRQDDHRGDDRAHPARRAGSIPPTWSAASSATPGSTPAGGAASGSWSRPTSRTARCSGSWPEIAVLTNAELDHHSTYSSRLDLEQTLREFMGRAEARRRGVGPPAAARPVPAGGALAYDAPDTAMSPRGSRFHWRGIEVSLAVPGRPQRRQRGGRADRVRAGGGRSGRGRRRSG